MAPLCYINIRYPYLEVNGPTRFPITLEDLGGLAMKRKNELFIE
jgi:hypothetical protein